MSRSKKTRSGQSERPDPYYIDKFARVSPRLKIGFLKFWLAGMSFYLAVMGLPTTFDYLDRMVMWTLLMILGTEYIVNPIIYWMKNDKCDTYVFLPHTLKRKTFLSFLLTLAYVVSGVFFTHYVIELWVSMSLPTIGDIISEATADPFSFALVFLLFDFLWRLIFRLGKKFLKKGDNDA